MMKTPGNIEPPAFPKGQPVPVEVSDIRWMLEELRVSFFAQTLGTPYPISDKRVLQAIHGVKI